MDIPAKNRGPNWQQPQSSVASSAAANTVIWSEDFASGIPSSWTNQGYTIDPNTQALVPNALANWEYRGPNTTPNTSLGSRGGFASGTPISSSTSSNGFIIFDSGYLDNAGTTAIGSGPAPAPHIGTLRTDPINLSGYPSVELSFDSYARVFLAEFAVAVSTDGGSTFPDTVFFHSNLPLNNATANSERVSANISSIAGGSSNVVLSFIFDGRPGNINGNGYYFWMIDDIELSEVPLHDLRFTAWQGAPAYDIIYDGGASPKYGNLHMDQAVAMTFDANIYNFGALDQQNVQLVVNIVDGTNSLVATLSSPALASLTAGDTATYQNLTTTTSWTPSDTGTYGIYYSAISDSFSISQSTPELGYVIEVNDGPGAIYSYTFGSVDNYVGTNSLATGSIVSIGEAFTFPNASADTSGYVLIDGISVPFSSTSDPAGATLLWEVYDTTGFSYGTSGGPVGLPLFDSVYSVSNIVGTTLFFDFRSISGNDTVPLALPSNAGYHFILSMVPNGTGPVRIANDQTVKNQPVGSVVVASSTGQWFSGFGNSSNLSAPIFLMQMSGESGPPNSLPTASFTATPTSGSAPLSVSFDGSASSDPDGDPLSFNWEFGDGNTATGQNVQHTYTTWGDHVAKLIVGDGRGGLDSTAVQISVVDSTNTPPVASFTAMPDTGVAPLIVAFDGTGSTDADGDTLSYFWSFGDGSTSSLDSLAHTFQFSGNYLVMLTVDDGRGGTDTDTATVYVSSPPQSSSTIWSEDFDNGIPSGWTNQGYVVDPFTGNLIPSAAANWEYRGPNTTPDVTTGSRGSFTTGAPLASNTAANGFVIFDSDYLDSDGTGVIGSGPAPAPHLGTLQTTPIDLTGHPNVELSFETFARVFFADFAVAISTNGGNSFPDTVFFHTDLAVNAGSANGELVSADISAYAGNQSNVVLSFVFDGRPGNANGNGYYFWMVDDIEINDIPSNALKFVEWQGAPATDILYDGGASPKYGMLHVDQAVPLSFDANIFNYGTSLQYNTQLMVIIRDNNTNALVTTLSSPAINLNSGDTGTYMNLSTVGAWTPTNAGSYSISYAAVSDSIPAGVAPESTPYVIEVTDAGYQDGTYSYSFGSIDNYVGTSSLATGSIIAMGEAFTFPYAAADTSGYVFIDGMTVPFSTTSAPSGATIFWEVYDTTGFSYGTSGGPVGTPLFDSVYSVPSFSSGTVHFDFRTVTGTDTVPLSLPANAGYHFIMYMIPNSTNEDILVGNDQTVTNQPAGSVIISNDSGQWFSGFSNSDNLSSPIFMLEMAPSATGNKKPVVVLTANPTTGNIPLAVNFDASASTDADGDPLSFSWDFGNGNSGTGQTTTSTYTTGGSYWAVVTVTDGIGGTAKDSVEIMALDPNNNAPVASFTAIPDSGVVPLPVSFDASASSDPDNDPLTYSWEFGDNSTDTGVAPTHTYTSVGTYWAVLTVDDGVFATDMDSVEIIVSPVPNSAPTASFTAVPDSGIVPLTVGFNASASSDPDGDPLIVSWDFGDGNTGSAMTMNHTYTSVGNYWAVLTVDDGNGGTAQDSVEIVVSPVPNYAPIASFTATPDSGVVPLTVSFDASSSSDANNDILTYSWDFGNGITGTGLTASTTYTTPGTYCVELTVDDGNGASDKDTICIVASPVPNSAPMLSFIATPDTGGTPLVVSFDASATTDPDGDALSYSWDFGDGNAGTGVTAGNTYYVDTNSTDTTYWAVLSVSDGNGAIVTDSVAIHVINDIGLVELDPGLLSLYPNPTTGKVIINVEEAGSYTLEMMSMDGKRIYSESLRIAPGEHRERDFSHLPKGTYLISITGKNVRSIEKLTIE